MLATNTEYSRTQGQPLEQTDLYEVGIGDPSAEVSLPLDLHYWRLYCEIRNHTLIWREDIM